MAELKDNFRYFSIGISKIEKNPDGSIFVYGPATTDDIDSDQQIIDADFASKGLSDWLKTGANVRVMHSPNLYPAGKGVEIHDDGSAKWLKSKIVEPTAIRLVEEKVLQAYSVGIADAKLRRDRNGIEHIVGGEFVEVSLVDRPANSACKFELVKRAKDGRPVEVSLLKAEDSEKTDCALCKGTGKIKEGTTTCPKCKGEGMVAKADADAPAEKKSKPRKTKAPTGDKNPSGPDGSTEAKPSGTDDDGDSGDSDSGDSDSEDSDSDSGGDTGTDSDDDNDTKKAAEETVSKSEDLEFSGFDNSYESVMVRLHDVVCPAISSKKIFKVYPHLQVLGMQAVIDTDPITKAIQQATDELDDTGRITRLAVTLDLSAQVKSIDKEEFAGTRDEFHKAYKDEYPKTKVKPGDVLPGKFTRPFISSGRASMKPGQGPRLPLHQSGISASQFDRPGLTAGHERPSASKKKRSFYSNAAREQAAMAMQAMHDHIQAEFPEICGASMMDGYVAADTETMKSAKVVEETQVINTVVSSDTKKIGKLEKSVAKVLSVNKALRKKVSKSQKKIEKLESGIDESTAAWRGPGLPLELLKKSRSDAGKSAEPIIENEENERIIEIARKGNSQEARAAIEVLSKTLTDDQLVTVLTK